MTPLFRAASHAVVLGIVLALPETIHAQQAAPAAVADTGRISACFVPTSGTMYRIKVADTKPACVGNAIEFSWNVQGIKGDKGDKGDIGAQGPAGPGGTGSSFALPYDGLAATDLPTPAFRITNSGTGTTGWFVNSSTTTGTALRATASGTSTAASVVQTGTGVGLNVASAGLALFANSSNTGGSNAIAARSAGTFATIDTRNTGSAGSLYSEAANGAAGNFHSYGPNDLASAVTVEHHGAGSALNAVSKGVNATFMSRNNGTGSAGYMTSANQYNSLYIENTGTGSAAGFKNNAGNATLSAENATGSALVVRSGGTSNATISTENTGTGNALYATSKHPYNTIYANNTADGGVMNAQSKGSQGTIYVHNDGTGAAANLQSTTGTTLNLNQTGGGTGTGALFASSAAQNTAYFLNTGTGNNITIAGRGQSQWPVAQFEHATGGVALRTFGSADIHGDLAVTGNSTVTGSKNAIVPTSRGMTKVYSEESSEVWFTEYGEAHLVNGEATIPIEALFGETVDLSARYHVFVQANDDATLYVAQRTPTGFTVKARDGLRDASFSFRLVAKRRGYANDRLEVVK